MPNPACVTTTGALWNLFYADKTVWPEDSYHDDTLIAINGKADPDAGLDGLAPDATVEIQSGYVRLPDGTDADLGEYFQKWQVQQSGQGVVVGTFRVTQDKLEAVRQAIAAAGGELLN